MLWLDCIVWKCSFQRWKWLYGVIKNAETYRFGSLVLVAWYIYSTRHGAQSLSFPNVVLYHFSTHLWWHIVLFLLRWQQAWSFLFMKSCTEWLGGVHWSIFLGVGHLLCLYVLMASSLTASCFEEGQEYRDQEEWQATSCTKCVCSAGETHCYTVQCLPVVCQPVST